MWYQILLRKWNSILSEQFTNPNYFVCCCVVCNGYLLRCQSGRRRYEYVRDDLYIQKSMIEDHDSITDHENRFGYVCRVRQRSTSYRLEVEYTIVGHIADCPT